jgi:molybdate-binding protein
MTAPIITLADAVVTALNAATLSMTFTASRVYVPKFDVAASEDLQVRVVPASDPRTPETAATDVGELVIHIGVFKRLTGTVAGEVAEIDALMDLCEELRAVVNRQRLTGAEESICTKIAQEPIYSVEEIDAKRVFLTVLACTFTTSIEV